MIFLFWIGFAIVVGVAASNRGRNGAGWGLLAILISPLLAGLLLFVLPRRDAFADIATLAMIEATPEGSRSRQLLAEHEAKTARIKQDGVIMASLLGSSDNRPWSPNAPTASRFIMGISIWAGILLFVGIGLIGYKANPQAISAIAVPAASAVQPAAKPIPKPQQSKQMDCINGLILMDRMTGGGPKHFLGIFPDLSPYEAACPKD